MIEKLISFINLKEQVIFHAHRITHSFSRFNSDLLVLSKSCSRDKCTAVFSCHVQCTTVNSLVWMF